MLGLLGGVQTKLMPMHLWYQESRPRPAVSLWVWEKAFLSGWALFPGLIMDGSISWLPWQYPLSLSRGPGTWCTMERFPWLGRASCWWHWGLIFLSDLCSSSPSCPLCLSHRLQYKLTLSRSAPGQGQAESNTLVLGKVKAYKFQQVCLQVNSRPCNSWLGRRLRFLPSSLSK